MTIGSIYVPDNTVAAPTSVDDFDALPSSGSDGDWRTTDDDERTWRAKTTDSTFLWWPAEWYGGLSSYALNATGNCKMLLADDEAAAVARGWVDGSASGGTATKSAGSHMIVDSGASAGGLGWFAFTATTNPSKWAAAFEVKASQHGGTDLMRLQVPVGGTRYVLFDLAIGGTLGTGHLHNDGGQLGAGQIVAGSDWFWVYLRGDDSDAQGPVEALVPGITRECLLQRSQLSVVAKQDFALVAARGNSRCIIHCRQAHWLTMT